MQKNKIKKLSPTERRVLRLIPRGAERPRTASEIARLAGLKRRHVQQIIHDLRDVHGLPIGFSNRNPYGYFLITNEEERRVTLNSLNSQLRELTTTINVIANTALNNS